MNIILIFIYNIYIYIYIILKTVWSWLNPGPTVKPRTHKHTGLITGPVLTTLLFTYTQRSKMGWW